MIASEEKAGKGRQTKRIVENKGIRGGEETGERREKKGRRRSRRKMVRERRTGEGMRGQKCVGGKGEKRGSRQNTGHFLREAVSLSQTID